LLEEFDGKAIIWARFVPELELIAEALRVEYGNESVLLYHGGTSDDERAEHRHRFQNDAAARFFVASQSAAGIGITLTEASLVVYYSNTFDFEHRAQSEDRAHRIGQIKSVTYVDLVADNTLDGRIVQALKDKKDLAAIITKDNVREML
jgi:SNF2 family DNA or RNA helicase